jgi:hypothetical protein
VWEGARKFPGQTADAENLFRANSAMLTCHFVGLRKVIDKISMRMWDQI